MSEVVLSGVGNRNFAGKPTMSLDDYILFAKKVISKFAGKMSRRMLKDEDAISYVAESIMMGSMRWDASRGSSLDNYHVQCGIWGIKKYRTQFRLAKDKTRDEKSFDFEFSSGSKGGHNKISLFDTVEDDKQKRPLDILCGREDVTAKDVVNLKCLTERQKQCMSLYFLEDKTMREIADILHVSFQAVQQSINNGIRKLREHYGELRSGFEGR